ncbi:MAG: sugar ABC transporter ATP-binding protein [Synechococcales bacterium]|nr:sugar ABC transporter ATP-binding protein [Synechococcales bacterium]
MQQAPVLHTKGLVKQFGSTSALRNASLALQAGEVHILLGENGAGKSTLAKVLAGVYHPDAGTVCIEGQPVSIRDRRTARRLGIGMVFQELSLAPHLSVSDNLWLGNEPTTFPLAWLPRRREQKRCQSVLEEFGIAVAPNTPVAHLSVAQKQLLEITKALLPQPRILILDEPTATLTEQEKRVLFQILRQLQKQGVAILYVTHHLQEVFELGTRVSTMTDGTITATLPVTPDLTATTLLEMLTGRNLAIALARTPPPTRRPLLTVDNLRLQRGGPSLSLSLQTGEILGIYGIVGCGRESLGRAIAGLLQPKQGTLTLAGQPYAPRNRSAALARGVGYLPMDRKENGILPQRPIRENLTLSHLNPFTKLGFLHLPPERQETSRHLQKLQVRYRSAEEAIAQLSGGNQQKVLLGRAIAPAPRLLVLEDPTAGIDMGTRLELYQHLRELAAQGTGILMLSSDLAETLLLCDRVYSMYAGRLIREFINPSLQDEEAILADVLGHTAPSLTPPA